MLPHKGSLSRDERQWQLTEPPSWAPVGWFALVVIGTALTWSMCLPAVDVAVVAPKPQQVFHLEWFLTGTALSYLVWSAARSSWLVAVPSVLLASAQMLAIADDGAQRLQQAGLLSAETDMLYVVAVLQVLLFVTAGALGVRQSLARRRWAKLDRQLAALDSVSRPPKG